MSHYNNHTFQSKNFIARYAHISRVKIGAKLTSSIASGDVLDYGCGTAFFMDYYKSINFGNIAGYEPFRNDFPQNDLVIYRNRDDIPTGKFSLVTLFETAEHMSSDELRDFIEFCRDYIMPVDGILVSVPIEIGPILLIKEFNRYFFKRENRRYTLNELLKTTFLFKCEIRDESDKNSHKNFDFRKLIKKFEKLDTEVTILDKSPFPKIPWFFNSQIFFHAKFRV